MSETKTSQPELSRRELVNRKGGGFSELLGDFYGDIYRQMHNLYPCRELEEVSAYMDPKTGWFVGGEGEDEEGNAIPMIGIGTNPELDSRTIKDRVVSRFGIPKELIDSDVGVTVCRIVAFAHELGHVVQMNPKMQEKFGGLREGYILSGKDYTDQEYEEYVRSDSEGNADYIAATVLASSDFGRMLGMEMPDEEVGDWRGWATKHPVLFSPSTATNA